LHHILLKNNNLFFTSASEMATSRYPIAKKRLNKVDRSKYHLDEYLKQVLVGNTLGDIYMRRFSVKSNTRLIFRQGSINTGYLLPAFGR
jgi:hypothetical protein